MTGLDGLLAVPAERRSAIERMKPVLAKARRAALLTHVSADGDGCGSEAALSRVLAARGIESWIVNPTPWPSLYDFLLEPPVRDRSPEGATALADADLIIVLDISEIGRLGTLAAAVRGHRAPKMVIDHHVPGGEQVSDLGLVDAQACATGELLFDLAVVMGIPVDEPTATALYSAILSDTGGFRFSNTSPRAHAIAATLLAAGVDPEDMYRRIYASSPASRVRLLAEALGTLEVDTDHGLAWLSVPEGAVERHGVGAEDYDGIVEHPRSIAGVRLALLFREISPGKTKVSFRSSGDVDAQKLARQFGGGGHVKASGALINGPLEEVQRQVVDAARQMLARA